MKHTPSHLRRALFVAWLERFKGQDITLIEEPHGPDEGGSVYRGELRRVRLMGTVDESSVTVLIDLERSDISTRVHDRFAAHTIEMPDPEWFSEWLCNPDFEPVRVEDYVGNLELETV